MLSPNLRHFLIRHCNWKLNEKHCRVKHMQKLSWILMRDCSPGWGTFATYMPHVGFFVERPVLWKTKPCSSCTKWQVHLALSITATEREETILLLGDWNIYMVCGSPGVIKAEFKNKTSKVSTCTQAQSPQSQCTCVHHVCTRTYMHIYMCVYDTYCNSSTGSFIYASAFLPWNMC